MTLDEIGKYFGFADRQPIIRLFKKFDLQSRSKSDSAKVLNREKYEIISKEKLENLLKTESILQIAKQYNVHRARIHKLMKIYNLESDYFINKDIREKLRNYKNVNNKSLQEIANELGTEIGIVKRYIYPTQILYTKEEIKSEFSKLKNILVFDNQGVVKQLKMGSSNLYNSILFHAKNHKLTTNKFTEKFYRILNDYDPEDIITCKHCDTPLKFYTFERGYGNSERLICKNCSTRVNGVSIVSQKLFFSIYEKLNDVQKNNCYFSELNNEKNISITPLDISKISEENRNHLNKNRYVIDFLLFDKIIEFDGTFYHAGERVLKDIAKDEFVTMKGYKILHIKENDFYKNPDETIQKCLTFLNQ